MKSTYDIFMNFFEKRGLARERKVLISKAYGSVLEIGVGTGVNFSYYNSIISLQLTDYKLNTSVYNKADNLKVPYEIKEADVMNLPYDDESFDSIVCTLVFCSVEDVLIGLQEIKRVLKADGQYIFIEHVLPTEKKLIPIFNGLTPIWKRLASNCHLNRVFTSSLDEAGFTYTVNNRFFKTAFISGIAKKTDF